MPFGEDVGSLRAEELVYSGVPGLPSRDDVARERVFLIATANDIECLPPELLRKGRFDEIFFVDLPTPAVRGEIFAIHLARRGVDAKAVAIDALVAASDGFSGAEIEAHVRPPPR